MSQASDRNVLLAVLAVELGFIGRDAVLGAMSDWARGPQGSASLAALLVERGLLNGQEQALLETAVEKHLGRHGGAAESIAALGAESLARELLDRAPDPGLEARLVELLQTAVPTHRPAQQAAVDGPTHDRGRFRVLGRHAGGGLGEVFLAEDEELHREVALKEIRAGYADEPDLRARFVLEAEITGRLEHPGIVPVYGLGRHPDGRPFYAMRLIRGESLKAAIDRFHSDSHPRDPSARVLALRKLLTAVIDVCNAVAYAHSRGVIHRDIKPDNVMLGPYGETLLVDWGLAKLVVRPEADAEAPESADEASQGLSTLRPVAADGSTPTELGSAVGTPAYMSPEQAAGLVDQLGPACDVYGLGALLYVILTGRPPVEGQSADELRRAVMVGRFPPPRKVNPGAAPPLEAMCLKAMALDPARRYTSARHLAADIEAWLADEPVTAWREPFLARAGRWMRRHRTAVSGAVAAMFVALVSLVVGVVLLSAANENVRRAKGEAERGQEAARENFQMARDAVDKYLTHVSNDPRLRARGLEPLRRDLLATAREFYQRLIEQRPDEPELEWERGRAHFRLAGITAEIGSKHQAAELLAEARRVFESLADRFPDRPAYRAGLAKVHINLGLLHREAGRVQEARSELLAAQAIGEELTARHPDEPECQVDLANVHANLAALEVAAKEFDAAEASYQAALAIRRRLAESHPEVAEYRSELAGNQSHLGLLYHLVGRHAEAEEALLAARDLQEELVEGNPDTPYYRSDLATTWHRLGVLYAELRERFTAAEAAHRAALAIRERLAAEHPYVAQYRQDLARSHNDVATLYCAHGRLAAAEDAFLAAREIHEALVAEQADVPEHRNDLAATLSNLANLYADTSRAEEAEGAYRESIRIRQRLAAEYPENPDYRSTLAITYNNLATLLTFTGRLNEADVAFRAAIRIRERLLAKYPHVGAYAIDLGTTCANAGHLAIERGHVHAALELSSQATKTLGELPPATRDLPAVREALRNAHWAQAAALAQQGSHDEAMPHWDRALELDAGVAAAQLRLERARSLAHAGEHARATAEARELRDAAAGDGEALYRLAVVWALATGAVGDDASLEPGERETSADEYAAAAIKLLLAAGAAGYFADGARAAQLDDDPDLAPLRDRGPFRRLVEEVRGGRDPK